MATGLRLAEESETLESVILVRKRMEQESYPDIDLVDTVVIKSGPIAYKVANHWIFLNRHTGEVHHHAVTIETYAKRKAGWLWNEQRSVTMEDIDTSEIRTLLAFLASVTNANIPADPGRYLVLPITGDADTTEVNEEALNNFLELSRKSGVDVFSRLLDWAVQADNSEQVIEKLEQLETTDLQKLNTLVGLSGLKNVLAIWEANKENDDEEFWQTTLRQNSFVFSQIFSFPVIVLGGKVYVGGKGIDNRGGNLLDFLCANNLTKNTALVEIKTPRTRLLGNQYRGDVYNVSSELSGATIQVSNYKDSLTKEYDRLVNQADGDFEAFNPPCLVILGNTEAELEGRRQRKSFELFRGNLKDVQVITYDELFSKVQILVNLLEGNAE